MQSIAKKAYKKAWYEANKERQRELNRIYRENHKKKIKAIRKAYHEAHKDDDDYKRKRKDWYNAWYEQNKEDRAEYMKAYHQAKKVSSPKKGSTVIDKNKRERNLKIWDDICMRARQKDNNATGAD